MICQDCGQAFDQVMDFLVATPIWNYVMAGQTETLMTMRQGLFDQRMHPRVEGVGGVVCLSCFDRRAKDLFVPYRDELIVFGHDCWMGGNYNGFVPLPHPFLSEEDYEVLP